MKNLEKREKIDLLKKHRVDLKSLKVDIGKTLHVLDNAIKAIDLGDREVFLLVYMAELSVKLQKIENTAAAQYRQLLTDLEYR